MRLETTTYKKGVIYSTYFVWFIYLVMILWFAVESVKEITNGVSTGDIVLMCFTVLWFAGGIVMLRNELRFRVTTSKIMLNQNGVRYSSDTAQFFLPWERVQMIRGQFFTQGRGEPLPYIVFYTNYSKQRRLDLVVKNVSDEFIFVHYEKEIEDFLDRQCGWSIIDPYNGLRKQRKKWERKQQRLWRRLLREVEKHNQ